MAVYYKEANKIDNKATVVSRELGAHSNNVKFFHFEIHVL